MDEQEPASQPGSGGRKRWSIARQMSVSTAALVAVVVAVFLVITRDQLDTLAEEQAEARGEAVDRATRQAGVSISRAIAIASAVALAEGGYTFIQSLLETMARSNPDLQWVVVADEEGRVVADSRGTPGAMRSAPLSADVTGRVRGAALGEVVELPTKDTRARVLATAIVGHEEPSPDEPAGSGAAAVIGYVEVAIATGVHEREAARARQSARERVDVIATIAAVAAFVLIVLGIAVAIVQSLSITRPLRRLSAQARRIAHGEIGQVETSGATEIQELSSNLNHMAGQLGELLVETAKQAALAKEVEIAQLVQKSLVPPSHLFHTDGLDLIGFYEPANKCAGDWWMWRKLENGRILLLIGDVTGHGLPTALIAAAAIGSAQTLPRNVTADRALVHVNEAVLRAARGEYMMSCFAAVIDAERQVVEFANAGHTFPYVVRSVGRSAELQSLVARGPQLGRHELPQFKVVERPMYPDDMIVLFTDGLNESRGRDGSEWGERRMQSALLNSVKPRGEKGPRPGLTEVRERIIATFRAFAGEGPPHDDVTLVLGVLRPIANAKLRARPPQW